MEQRHTAALKHLRFIADGSFLVYRCYQGKPVFAMEEVAIGLIRRLHATCVGLLSLLEKIEEYPQLEFSTGLILRTCMLDFLTGLKIYQIIEDNEPAGLKQHEIQAKVNDYCNALLGSGLEYSFQYFKTMKDAGVIDEQERNRRYRIIAAKFSRFVHPYAEDGNPPQLKEKNTEKPWKLFDQLARVKKIRHLARYYDIYIQYSKYEHFGVESEVLLQIEPQEQRRKIYEAIEGMLLHYFFCVHLLVYSPDCEKAIDEHYAVVAAYIHRSVGDELQS